MRSLQIPPLVDGGVGQSTRRDSLEVRGGETGCLSGLPHLNCNLKIAISKLQSYTNFRYVCYTSTLGEGAPLAVRPYGHLWHEF